MKTQKYFSVEDRDTKSAIIMDGDNEHCETLYQDYESDETWEEFVSRIAYRVGYLNKNKGDIR
jgi:hypothetical protein